MIDSRHRSPDWRGSNNNSVQVLSEDKGIDKDQLKAMMLELINDHSENMLERCKAVEAESMGLLTQEVSQAIVEVLREQDEKSEVSKQVINACQYFEAATQTFSPSPKEDNEVLSLEILPARIYMMTDSNKGRSVGDDKSSSKFSSKLSFATSKFGE
jgi:hypothetical protein